MVGGKIFFDSPGSNGGEERNHIGGLEPAFAQVHNPIEFPLLAEPEKRGLIFQSTERKFHLVAIEIFVGRGQNGPKDLGREGQEGAPN